VDCTLGMGGHAMEIIKAIGSSGRFIGIDRDSDSLAIARKGLKIFRPIAVLCKRLPSC